MAVTDIESSAWIRRYHPSGASTARLICFPHAGGSASYFHPVSERFSPATDVIALQYPGRQDRRHELCIRDIDVLADRITEQLLCLSHKPSVFFGHSMGATLAFEVAWRLERKGFNAPLHLTAGSPVVSGMGSWRRVGRVGPKRAAVRPVACRSWTRRNATAGGPGGGRLGEGP